MDEANILGSLCSNTPIQDLGLEDVDFDFDFFFNPDFLKVADTPAGVQQNQVPGPSARKKRRLNGAAQPYTKKKSIKHNHVCGIHQPPTSARCFGKWSKIGPYKGARCERTVATFVDGQLPVCAQHKAQVMKMTYCEAILECKFPCNEIVPLRPHGYNLCEAHLSHGKCWFLALPVEIRLMIYQYLMPDKPVPARRSGMRMFRDDLAPVSTAIFRVNKIIHEEVADLFYGQTTFDIDVTNERQRNATTVHGIYMCRAKDDSVLIADYQLQLMLLEQQNRTRMMRARAGAGGTTTSRPSLRKELATGIKYDFTPWKPSLSPRYFQRIRSFHLNITFNTPGNFDNAHGSSQTTETILGEAERNLLCDYLHRSVERLVMNNQVPLQNLDISIRIQGISDIDNGQANSKSIAHCQALINPIRRLRTRTARIVSLTRTGNGNRDIDMLHLPPNDEHSINEFVRSCCAELTNLLVPSPSFPVLTRFGQLTQLISQMSQHPFWRDTDIEEMEFLLDNGRSAREANDMTAMMLILRDVLEKLRKFNDSHQDFMKRMKQSFVKIGSK